MSSLIRRSVLPAELSVSQATQDTATALALSNRIADWATTTALAKGAGQVGFGYSLAYAANSSGWAAQQDTVKVGWFAAAVVGGDYALAIQAAANWAAALPSGGAIELPFGFAGVCKSPITIDCAKVAVVGNGATLDFSSLTGSAKAITLTNSAGTPSDLYVPSAVRNPFAGLRILGPGKAGAGAGYGSSTTGIYIAAPNIVVSECLVYGFGVGIDIYTAGYILKFNDTSVGQCAIGVRTASGGSNYGERNVFEGCTIYDNQLGISNNCPTGVLAFVNSSIDYNLKQLVATNSSVTELHNTWCECGDMGAGNVAMSLTTGAQLTMFGGRLQQAGTLGALAQAGYLNTDASSRASFDGVFMFNLQNGANVFDSGSGLIEILRTKSYGVSYLPSAVSAVANNKLSDGGFTTGAVADMWSIVLDSGTITNRLAAAGSSLSLSTAQAHGGSQCLKWTKNASGVNGDFILLVPIAPGPGTRCAFKGWLKKPVGSSSGTIYITSAAFRIEGTAANGTPNILASISFDVSAIGGTTALIDWAQFVSGMDRILPSWANYYGLYFSGNGFAGDLFLDDFNVSTM